MKKSSFIFLIVLTVFIIAILAFFSNAKYFKKQNTDSNQNITTVSDKKYCNDSDGLDEADFGLKYDWKKDNLFNDYENGLDKIWYDYFTHTDMATNKIIGFDLTEIIKKGDVWYYCNNSIGCDSLLYVDYKGNSLEYNTYDENEKKSYHHYCDFDNDGNMRCYDYDDCNNKYYGWVYRLGK